MLGRSAADVFFSPLMVNTLSVIINAVVILLCRMLNPSLNAKKIEGAMIITTGILAWYLWIGHDPFPEC